MKRILVMISLMAAAGISSAQAPAPAPDGSLSNSRAQVRAEAVLQNKNPGNSNTPGGEASTTRNNQPNATERTSQLTRGEVRQETLKTRPRFGDHKGERPTVPTNPKNMTGTPQ